MAELFLATTCNMAQESALGESEASKPRPGYWMAEVCTIFLACLL
jgi:hypothetical protein